MFPHLCEVHPFSSEIRHCREIIHQPSRHYANPVYLQIFQNYPDTTLHTHYLPPTHVLNLAGPICKPLSMFTPNLLPSYAPFSLTLTFIHISNKNVKLMSILMSFTNNLVKYALTLFLYLKILHLT